MNRRLTDLTFAEWVELTFGYPLIGPSSRRPRDADRWSGPPAVAVDYLTRTFENAAEVLTPYSDAQLAEGFWGLNRTPMHDNGVPWEQRRRCIRSIHSVFEECFAMRCETHLSHLDREGSGTNPLNTVCYMWWDIHPKTSGLNPAQAELTKEYLDVMRRTLLLDSQACQESALHGLGHWHWDFGHWRDESDPSHGVAAAVAETETLIDDYLARNPKLNPALRQYALSARDGMVQ